MIKESQVFIAAILGCLLHIPNNVFIIANTNLRQIRILYFYKSQWKRRQSCILTCDWKYDYLIYTDGSVSRVRLRDTFYTECFTSPVRSCSVYIFTVIFITLLWRSRFSLCVTMLSDLCREPNTPCMRFSRPKVPNILFRF